jgi:hypothetical protein
MSALIIPQSTTFGAMTASIVSRVHSLDSVIPRLQDAIATASSGYTGTPGTEFEAASGNALPMPPANNFGVQPDPDTPGQQGQAYAYAVGQLHAKWEEFMAAAGAYIDALDNGTASV